MSSTAWPTSPDSQRAAPRVHRAVPRLHCSPSSSLMRRHSSLRAMARSSSPVRQQTAASRVKVTSANGSLKPISAYSASAFSCRAPAVGRARRCPGSGEDAVRPGSPLADPPDRLRPGPVGPGWPRPSGPATPRSAAPIARPATLRRRTTVADPRPDAAPAGSSRPAPTPRKVTSLIPFEGLPDLGQLPPSPDKTGHLGREVAPPPFRYESRHGCLGSLSAGHLDRRLGDSGILTPRPGPGRFPGRGPGRWLRRAGQPRQAVADGDGDDQGGGAGAQGQGGDGVGGQA